MTVSFVELRDLRTAMFGQVADGWSQYAKRMDGLEDDAVHLVIGALHRSGWAGTAATAAYAQIDTLDEAFAVRARLARLARIVLEDAAAQFRALQKELHEAIDAATVGGLTVGDDGIARVATRRGISLSDYADFASAAIAATGQIGAILVRAGETDRQIAEVLDRLQPEGIAGTGAGDWVHAELAAQGIAGLLGVDPSAVPRPGADPKQASAWWQHLTDTQRTLYLDAYPALVGGLDGLPATDRDTANRLALQEHLWRLDTASSWSAHDTADLQRLHQLWDKLDQGEYGDLHERLLLLALDPANDGQAVVAVGDPDTAANTCVLVPGVGTTLDDMRGQIDRATIMQRIAYTALPSGGDGTVSVIAWLGYDTPGLDTSAIGYGHAQDGAPGLDRFVDGLHAAHTDTTAHTSVFGHSYGSTVIGEAARVGDGLAVDDIITAGSPGMDVNQAQDLHISPHHVWAGAAADDPISGILGSATGIHNDEPTDLTFGANQYHVDTSGHSGYWTPGSQSLTNIGHLIVGDYPKVTLDHGQAP